MSFARVARLLVSVIYLAAAGAFVADLTRANTLAYGIVYIPLICTGLLHRRLWTLWALTGFSILLVAIGAIIPVMDPDLPNLLTNRILSVLAILATALLVHHTRIIQLRLAEETRRAEAAERVRTDVLANLGREMRTPLHTMIAMLGLLLTNCRPDQRGPLGRMRAGSQQLLLTLDNLVGLTQIETPAPRLVRTNIAALLRDAVANARPVAEDSDVTFDLDGRACQEVDDAFIDPHLARRILDNLLFNAVRQARPPRTIGVSLRQDDAAVAVIVGDDGAYADRRALIDPRDTASLTAALMTPSIGVGLTFSRRLAEAMGGALEVACAPDEGMTITLRLPLASVRAAA